MKRGARRRPFGLDLRVWGRKWLDTGADPARPEGGPRLAWLSRSARSRSQGSGSDVATRFVVVRALCVPAAEAGLREARLRPGYGRAGRGGHARRPGGAESSRPARGSTMRRDHPHRVLANGATKRVNMPDAQNQVALLLGGQLEGRRWGNAGAVEDQLRRQPPLPHAAHLVARTSHSSGPSAPPYPGCVG